MENKHPKNYFGLNTQRNGLGYGGAPIKPNSHSQAKPASAIKNPINSANNNRNSLELCIHNKGKTGGKVGTGCKKEDEYSCALHGSCILNACSYSGTRTICARCPNFKHPDSQAAKDYLEELAKMEEQTIEQIEVTLESIENIEVDDVQNR